MTIDEQRLLVTEEAVTWNGTPYHHGVDAVKEAGASCASFICAVFNNALKLGLFVIEYPEQWYLNGHKELYLEELVVQGFVPITIQEAKPGDLVLSKTVNKYYCHGGIILDWPKVTHCSGTRGVEIVRSAYASWFFAQQPDTLKFMTRKEWK